MHKTHGIYYPIKWKLSFYFLFKFYPAFLLLHATCVDCSLLMFVMLIFLNRSSVMLLHTEKSHFCFVLF